MKSEILFVDDEECIRKVVERLLPRDDFSVSTYASGKNILAQMEEKKPSLIFLDIHMPDINGLDILKQIHQADPNMPVIMVSANLDKNDNARTATKLGACDYIAKPIDWDYLRNLAYLYSFLGFARGG